MGSSKITRYRALPNILKSYCSNYANESVPLELRQEGGQGPLPMNPLVSVFSKLPYLFSPLETFSQLSVAVSFSIYILYFVLKYFPSQSIQIDTNQSHPQRARINYGSMWECIHKGVRGEEACPVNLSFSSL